MSREMGLSPLILHKTVSSSAALCGAGGVSKTVLLAGNYLILDGYGAVQESSTDEEVSALVLRCAAGGRGSLDSAQQQPLSDGGSSPFAEDMMGTGDESCCFLARPHLSIESRMQMMQYIQKIEDDLEKLKV